MSDKEETPKSTPEPKAARAPAARKADDIHIVDAMKPAPAPASDHKPVRYGNRKKRPGESAPAVTSLGSSAQEEEEIEMDDLPVRATAPQELIDTRSNPSESRDDYDEDRPRRHDRSRGERRERKPRERAPEHESRERRPRRERERPAAEADTETTAAESPSEPASAEDRPERFGTVSAAESRARHHAQVSEFRPSQDGRTAPKVDSKRQTRSRPTPPKSQKKGILSKIISLFTGGESKEQERKKEDDAQNRDTQGRQEGRGRRGPRGPRGRQNREGGPEGEDGNRRRRRRPRNRKPRHDGEGGPARSEGGDDNRGRRRRPRRPRGDRERQQSPSE